MTQRYPQRKLSLADITKAVNIDSDIDDSTDRIEKLLGCDSGNYT